MWFETLTGFQEESPQQVRANLALNGKLLRSRVNGRELVCGTLSIPTLAELRASVQTRGQCPGKLSLREVVADVRQLHAAVSNAGSLFQVASQFNLLEMVSPAITPEHGVDIYEMDHTQGPTCAIAAGAGTIYRNYLVPVNGQIGQSAARQIDCLADIGEALGNPVKRLWEMKNGYALPNQAGLEEIAARLRAASEADLDALRQKLRIGLQWNTQVTIGNATHLVSQAYCSALPVAYSPHDATLWEPFARLILEATYEATLCAAILNAASTGNNRVYLTLLGGGAFGNRSEWILDALQRSLIRYNHADLDIAIVSYGASNPKIRQRLSDLP